MSNRVIIQSLEEDSERLLSITQRLHTIQESNPDDVELSKDIEWLCVSEEGTSIKIEMLRREDEFNALPMWRQIMGRFRSRRFDWRIRYFRSQDTVALWFKRREATLRIWWFNTQKYRVFRR